MTSATHVPELPDTDLARSLVTRVFAEESTPVANHSVRTYLLGTIYAGSIGVAAGSDFDERVFFASCVLHDVGLTAAADGELRFEVDGADYASRILTDHDFTPGERDAVWEAIALHTSPHIADRRNLMTRLVRSGVGLDFGRGVEIVEPSVLDAIHERYPLLNFEHVLVDEILTQVAAKPVKAPMNSFPDTLNFERSVSGTTRLEQAGAARR